MTNTTKVAVLQVLTVVLTIIATAAAAAWVWVLGVHTMIFMTGGMIGGAP